MWAPSSPHSPYTPSPEHRHDFDDVTWDPPALNETDMSDKPTWLRNLPPQDRARMRGMLEGKLEELQDLDDQVDRLLDVLWRTDQLDRTWIFFVSDNGYLLGEHRLALKEHPYEESAGIPYVVRGPGVEPGTRDAFVSQVDLMPTTLAIAGLDPDAGRELSRPLDAGTAPHRRLVGLASPAARREPGTGVGHAPPGLPRLHRAPRARRVGALRPGRPTRTSSPAAGTPTSPDCRHG